MSIDLRQSIANKFVRPALENPSEAGFGFLAGVGKGIVDVPVMLGGAVGGTLAGKGPLQGAADADNNMYSAIKEAYKNINPNDDDVNEKVLYGSTLAGSLVSPGKLLGKVGSKLAEVPTVGKYLESVVGPGGIIGRAGNAVEQAKTNAILGLGSKIFPAETTSAPLLQNIGKVGKKVEDTLKKITPGADFIGGHTNPRQMVDLITKETPDYYQRLESVFAKGDKILSKDDIAPYLQGLKDKELNNIIKSEFGDLSPVGQNTVMEHLKYERRFADLKTDPILANKALDESINNYKKFKGTHKEGEYFSNLMDTASAPIQAYNNKIKQSLIVDNINEYDRLIKEQPKYVYDLYKKLDGVDPKVAEKVLHSSDRNLVSSFLSPLAMFNKFTPSIGDAYQFAEGSTAQFLTAIKRAGLENDTGRVLSNVGSDFRTSNQKIMNQEFYAPYDLLSKLSDPATELVNRADLTKVSNSAQKWFKDAGKAGTVQALGKAVEAVSFGEQQGVRMTIINNIVDKAEGLVKTSGLKIGTPEFNTKVVNLSKEMLRGIGFIPEEAVYESGGKLVKHIDDIVKGGAQKHLGNTASSALFFLSSWPKMAKQGILKSYNSMGDAFHNIAKTGQASQADRIAILEGAVNLSLGGLMFGARGLKVPLAVDSMGAPVLGIKEEDTPVTGTLNGIMEFFATDPALRKSVLDGLYGHLTGATAGQQINTPIAGILLGSPILKSSLSNIVDTVSHSGQALFAGDPATATEILGDLLVSTDVEKQAERLSTGGIQNFKGEDISADLTPEAQERGSWQNNITGTLTPQSIYKSSMESSAPFKDLGSREETFLKLYGSMSQDEFNKKKSNLLPELQKITTDKKDMARIIKNLAEMRMIPSKNTAFKKFHMYGKKIVNMPDDPETLKRIKSQFTEDDIMRSLATAIILEDKTAVLAIAKIQPDIIKRDPEKQNSRLTDYLKQLKQEISAKNIQDWRALQGDDTPEEEVEQEAPEPQQVYVDENGDPL